MPDSPHWLPALPELGDFDGDWEAFLAAARRVFEDDFLEDRPQFRNMRMGLKRHPPVKGENCTFWHMCTCCPRGDSCPEEKREWDQARIERIRWPKPIFERVDVCLFRVWEERRPRGERRIHIWLVEEDYIVILARRHDSVDGDYVLPWATFLLQRENQRDEYMRRYQRWS